MISGILAVDKPLGWTSHDVVARVRRIAGQRRVGHAGTLDPLATGVLVLLLGHATRLSAQIMGSDKVYCAEVVLGATTATDDAEGELETRRDIAGIGRADVENVLMRFVGEVAQVPPRFAAIKRGGQKMYVLARRGEDVKREPRRVVIHAIEVERVDLPCVRLRVNCGAGTYIRSLARDIGEALGVGAYLHALRRVASGSITVDSLSQLESLESARDISAALLPLDFAVLTWPAVILSPEDLAAVLTGRPIRSGQVHGSIRMYAPSGALVALGDAVAGMIRPYRVFGGAP